MSDSFSWQHFSVQEFFRQSNWEGGSQKVDEEKIFEEISWLCLKIEDFFSHSNWQGELLEKVRSSSLVFSLNLAVSDFFQCFVWEGQPKIAALPELNTIPESNALADNNMTLDDLSDLF